jgi:hypothetical protein
MSDPIKRGVAPIERRRRAFKRHQPDLYAYILAHENEQTTSHMVADEAETLWNVTMVAAHCGVKVSTISAYNVRGQMPQPDHYLGGPVWRAWRIIAWQQDRVRRSSARLAATQRPVPGAGSALGPTATGSARSGPPEAAERH